MYGLDVTGRSNYFEEEKVRRTAQEVKVKKLKNGEEAGKDEVTGEMIEWG